MISNKTKERRTAFFFVKNLNISLRMTGKFKPPSGREGDRGGRFPNANVMSVWGSPVAVEGARRE
jgi:hypothetical protein